MSLLNGHKKVLGLVSAIGSAVGIFVGSSTFYLMWTRKVEAGVVQQRMVNEHDETLKAIVPKVETCHEVNRIQDVRLDRTEADSARLNAKIERLVDKIDLLVQSQMRDGKIPR